MLDSGSVFEVRPLRLDDYLRGKRMSHNRFARLSGVAQSTVSRIGRLERGEEGGDGGVSRRIAVRIMAATSGCVRIEDLMRVGRDDDGSNL